MSQIIKKFIKNDAVGATKIQLENNANLRARNAADSADINILKVDATDKVVFASVPQITGTPSAANDVASVSYVQSVLEGLNPKEAVLVVSTSNVALTGLQTIDGVLTVANDRVLLIGQTNPIENGIYLAAAGAWSRSADANTSAELKGLYTVVRSGTVGVGQGYVCTVPDSFVLGTDPVTFVLFKAAADFVGGNGISITGNTIDVDLASNPGLEFSTNQLRVKVNPAGAITRGASGIASSVDSSTVKINGSNQLEGLKDTSQLITLSGTDITNQYVDLASAAFGSSASANSISMTAVGGPVQTKTVDYTVSLTGGAGGVTRLTFAGDLATGGASELVATDQLMINYSFLT